MATHRRGTRPAQWPVRDLLAQRRPTTGGPRDPRLLAAVSGLLACGAAAATVAFSATDGRLGVGGPEPSPGPVALPAPGAAAPAPATPGVPGGGPTGPGPTDGRDPGSTRPGWAGGGPSSTRAAPTPPADRPSTREGPRPRGWRVAPEDRSARVALPAVDLMVAESARPGGVLLPLPREIDIGASWSRHLEMSCTGADGGSDEDTDCGGGDDSDDSDGDDSDDSGDGDDHASDRSSDETAEHAAARRPALAILVAAGCGDPVEHRIDAATVLAALDELQRSEGCHRER